MSLTKLLINRPRLRVKESLLKGVYFEEAFDVDFLNSFVFIMDSFGRKVMAKFFKEVHMEREAVKNLFNNKSLFNLSLLISWECLLFFLKFLSGLFGEKSLFLFSDYFFKLF